MQLRHVLLDVLVPNLSPNREVANTSGKPNSLQLRVLRHGLFQDGDVGIGVFPEREEVLARIPRARGGSFSLEHQHDTVAALRRLELRHNHRNQ